MNSGKLLLGVLAGAATGALLGLLFAPHKGTVTRKKISRNSGYLADQVKGKFGELVDNIAQEFTKVKNEVIDFSEEKMSNDHEPKKAVRTF